MRTFIRSMVLAAAVAGVGWQAHLTHAQTAQTTPSAPTTRPAADVPVKQVVLFSSGVGYFEHFGNINGDGTTELRFKTSQINDILKSLVLQDLDGGTVNTITYPSHDPIAKTLRSFQVDIAGNPSMADLLNQLRGAKVTVQEADRTIDGTILGVETKKRPVEEGKEPVEVSVLNLIAGEKMLAIELDNVRSIELQDPQLQDELNRALTALAQARDQDKKSVQIHFAGEGHRRVRLGYVVETPIWKTSYRLILPATEEDKPRLQGWAIVENQTDNDWDNVQLSLVSGRPISFVMDLYQPLYIPRPVVMPELYASLRPQTYDAGVDGDLELGEFARQTAGAGGVAGNIQAQRAANDALGKDVASRARALREEASRMRAITAAPASAPGVSQPMDAAASVRTIASAAKVGELFQYTVGNVSLPRQKSAMIPIITDDIEVERLSIYNASVLPKNPLNGARVKNTTDKHLLQGPITVLDDHTYAGDAQIDNVPPDQERLLSYGIDLQMRVDATTHRNDSALMTAKIVKGVLELTHKNVFAQQYVAENKSEKTKTLIVEHPRRQGWTLVDTDKPIETTETLYRFKGMVEPGKGSKLIVKEEIVQGQSVAILPADITALVAYAKHGSIPEDVRKAIGQAIEKKQTLIELQRQIDQHKEQIKLIAEEQNRIRENMKTVRQPSPYYDRLMTKLNDQESRIETLQTEIESLTEQLEAKRAELETFLANLNVG
ncbi:MAG TPA: hypothetical protein VGR35_04110 [Tepidisphaeraceae bacterium]|nr:hypothetical protein [Tepidisphaeraceae bacterium]